MLLQVTLRTVPTYNLLEQTVVMPREDVLDKFSTFMTVAEYVKFLVEFHTGKVQVVTCSRTEQEPVNQPSQFSMDVKVNWLMSSPVVDVLNIPMALHDVLECCGAIIC